MKSTLAIDEFKDNATGEEYRCILTDSKNRIVLDILPTRFENDMNSYFGKYENEQRRNARFFVFDMWKPYFRMANISSIVPGHLNHGLTALSVHSLTVTPTALPKAAITKSKF